MSARGVLRLVPPVQLAPDARPYPALAPPRTMTVLEAFDRYLPLDPVAAWESVQERVWALDGFTDLCEALVYSPEQLVRIHVHEVGARQVARDVDEELLVAAARTWSVGCVLAYRVD